MRPLNIFYILGEWPGCRKDSAIPSEQQVWSNPWLKYNALGDPQINIHQSEIQVSYFAPFTKLNGPLTHSTQPAR